MKDEALVKVRNLQKYFPITKGVIARRHVGDVKAVDGISFDVFKGETLGLVGESGCGKSTTGRTILNLHQATGGSVEFDGVDLTGLSKKEMIKYRKSLQMIFQDPYASLNPRMTIGNIISEAMIHHKIIPRSNRQARVEELLELVGLRTYFIKRYPHEFSGGQRQRIGIARALALNPEFIVCDEPISALDVSIQAQVVNLLQDLQGRLGLTYLFIAHDLSMVRHISDRIAVMYLGKIVELTDKESLYAQPLHPYTEALLSAVPIPDPKVESDRERIILQGDVPSPSNPPKGCNFSTRCPKVMDKCRNVEPEYREVKPGHFAACHLN
jgi:oligopeptide transport system ATP-binding protein